MRITREVSRSVTEVETVDVLCNKCGKSCRESHNLCGLIEAQVGGGYDSPVLGDLNEWTFSLCERCLGSLFSTFVLPPVLQDNVPGGVDQSGPVRWVDGAPAPAVEVIPEAT